MRRPIPFVADPPAEEVQTPDHRNVIPAGAQASVLPLARRIADVLRSEFPRLASRARLDEVAMMLAGMAQRDAHEINKLFWSDAEGCG